MKKLCALILAAAAVGPAAAQKWTLLTEAVNGKAEYSVLIDPGTIRPQGRFIKGWVLYRYKTPLPDYSTGKSYIGAMQLQYADCEGRSMAAKQQTLYADLDTMETVRSANVPDAQLEWSDPVPGTVGVIVLNRLCARH